MAEAIVAYVVGKLEDALTKEVKAFRGFDGEMRNIKSQLQSMHSFLTEAYQKKDQDERVKTWILQVRDLAHDVENVVDYVRSKSWSSGNNWATTWKWKRHVGTMLEQIKAQTSQLTTNLHAFGIPNSEAGTSTSSSTTASLADQQRLLRRTLSHVPVNDVVGLGRDIETLVAKLVGKDDAGTAVREHPVIAICGMGGLGKTTLAKKVYGHPRIKDCFPFLTWVYISSDWRVGQEREILETILFKLISEKEREDIMKNNLKDEGLAKILYTELQKKRYLLVLDDIWDANIWKILSPGFPTQGMGSKIMLTTRNRDVGIKVDPKCYIHELQLLSLEDSWELFRGIAIAGRDDTGSTSYENLDKLGKEIVRHCGGLPLAIIVLGGLLATKQTIYEWDKVHENIKSYLKGRGKEEFDILQVLALSYDDLPPRLRTCFLHLAQFPEDYLIDAKKLVNLWVAEDFIPAASAVDGEGEETLEDIAYGFLEELAQRYMVIVEKWSHSGWIKICKMHDLIREVCLSKAKEDEFWTFVNVNEKNQGMKFLSPAMVSRGEGTGKIRRISVTFYSNCNQPVASRDGDISSIRSLSGFQVEPKGGIGQHLIDSIAQELRFARVLDLENVKGFCIPKNIGKLACLRLMDVRSAWIGILSSSLGELLNLQTLYLDRHHSASELPDVFWKMKMLRHLYLPSSCGKGTKRLRFANLSHLQTLVNFPASCADMKDLITLTNLRKLVVMIEKEESLQEFMEIFKPSEVGFSHLRSLSIQTTSYYLRRTMELSEEEKQKILLCCPRLHRLKLAGRVLYRKAPIF